MWADRAIRDPGDEDVHGPPWDDLDVGQDLWLDPVCDEVGETLFLGQWVLNTEDVVCLISTPSTSSPPAVFANATTVFMIGPGEERSRLNSSVLPS
jgi:hypothetical protein